MTPASKAVFGKIRGSGWKRIVVPEPRAGFSFRSAATGFPRRKLCCQRKPSRFDVAISSCDSALTTLAPTPCRPPAVR